MVTWDPDPAAPAGAPGDMSGHLVLTVNAGSSSVKVDVFDLGTSTSSRIAVGVVTGLGSHGELRWSGRDAVAVHRRFGGGHADAVRELLRVAERGTKGDLVAVGHRIAHGGADHVEPELVDESVLRQLDHLVPLAPLHLPHNLDGVRAVRAEHPDLPQALCYDTAFHETMPLEARHFALPRGLAANGIVRYGFHGLSYEHVARVLPNLLGERCDGRVVVAHLGAGASLCAMRARRSVATTMGFTPLDGIPMATRCGSIDPGVILHLLRDGMSTDEVAELLYHRAGLLGVSGISGDIRELLGSTDARAADAVSMFTYRIRESIGALAADLGGLDAIVFTGGIGEHQPTIRSQVCGDLSWLGVALDEDANSASSGRIDQPGSPVPVLVVAADEAQVIAEHTRELLS